MRAVLWWNPNTQILWGNKPIFAFLLLYTCTCTKQGEQYFIERTFYEKKGNELTMGDLK